MIKTQDDECECIKFSIKFIIFCSQVEEKMKINANNNPARIPYHVRLEPGKAGCFSLTWFSVNSPKPVKTEMIYVTPNVSSSLNINQYIIQS